MRRFDDLPESDQAALLVRLLLAMTEAGCSTIEELASKRDRGVTEVWKELCVQVNQPECTAPTKVESWIADQANSGQYATSLDAAIVKVRPQSNRDDTEMYRMSDIFGWHWANADGNDEERQALACAYVWGNELKENEIRPFNLYGPGRERIKVWLLREENLEIWDEVVRLADNSPRTNSGSKERFKLKQRFKNRGLSNATITALIAAGIDAPERLLFYDARDLKKLRGVGPVKLREIETYRAAYLPVCSAGSGEA